jgi:hypothetical protein
VRAARVYSRRIAAMESVISSFLIGQQAQASRITLAVPSLRLHRCWFREDNIDMAGAARKVRPKLYDDDSGLKVCSTVIEACPASRRWYGMGNETTTAAAATSSSTPTGKRYILA